MTATTPIWGKLADLFSKKLLVQSALVIYSAGSLVAGFAPTMEVLIGARVDPGPRRRRPDRAGPGRDRLDGDSPRERGRYSGYLGAVFALATVSGPLIGGLIVDTPLGWRGCFFVGLPVALLAFVVLQKTLHLPVVKRPVHIDYLGATLLVGGRLDAAGLGLASPATSSPGAPRHAALLVAAAVVAPRRRGATSRPGSPSSRSSRCGSSSDRTTALATARLGADRRRDVRLHRLPEPVLPAGPRA